MYHSTLKGIRIKNSIFCLGSKYRCTTFNNQLIYTFKEHILVTPHLKNHPYQVVFQGEE